MIVSATDRTNIRSSSFTQQLNQLLRKWNRSVSIILSHLAATFSDEQQEFLLGMMRLMRKQKYGD